MVRTFTGSEPLRPHPKHVQLNCPSVGESMAAKVMRVAKCWPDAKLLSAEF